MRKLSLRKGRKVEVYSIYSHYCFFLMKAWHYKYIKRKKVCITLTFKWTQIDCSSSTYYHNVKSCLIQQKWKERTWKSGFRVNIRQRRSDMTKIIMYSSPFNCLDELWRWQQNEQNSVVKRSTKLHMLNCILVFQNWSKSKVFQICNQKAFAFHSRKTYSLTQMQSQSFI